MTDLHSPRLSDKVADALVVKMGIVDDADLAAAKAMRQHYDDAAIVSGLEQYASDEFKKVALATKGKQ